MHVNHSGVGRASFVVQCRLGNASFLLFHMSATPPPSADQSGVVEMNSPLSRGSRAKRIVLLHQEEGQEGGLNLRGARTTMKGGEVVDGDNKTQNQFAQAKLATALSVSSPALWAQATCSRSRAKPT